MKNPSLKQVKRNVKQAKQNVIKALRNVGYDVEEGLPYLFTNDGCDMLVPAFGSCFGNNPAAPYIIPIFPHRADEAYEYGPSMKWGDNADGQPLYATYRLAEDEATLVFGHMPPKGAFFSLENFMFTRYFDPDNITSPHMDWLSDASGLQHQLSPNPIPLLYEKPPKDISGWEPGGTPDVEYELDENRVMLFANLGPTANRRVLEDKIGKDFWGQVAILSTSPDKNFEAALNAELEHVDPGLPGRHVHTALGPDLKMGLSDRDDDFWTLMRYAVPEDKEAGEEWRKTIADQLVVLRVSKRDSPEVVRHPPQEFEEKGFKTDERQLAADLQQLAKAVRENLRILHPQEIFTSSSSIPLHGPFTVPRAMSDLGASHDCDAYRLSSAQPLETDGVFAIVGVNHTRTLNASYVSLGVYDSDTLTGLHSVSQSAEIDGLLNDSAQTFFNITGGAPPEIDLSLFYIHVLAREGSSLEPAELKSSTLCSLIGEGDNDESDSDAVIPVLKPIRIVQRGYLNPDASCGADPTKTLSPIFLRR